ncbi:TRAP-type C4-dicarboxylate transport system, large permease component [Pseudorhizobium banfieldiae]|uniref:TRAP transporter large permease protein n=1 Tax=Pseudorhizobium banfieldiae TaxID=1125847 RepID=L0NM06_9HYPH|nr:TRAP transporter large permease [Pseudorhizobium banfieldiae]CAD6596159.1 TRAP transporter large permease [arsenite-oxidising bacterium NT-25]CAD6617438.1 TRAP transporter large permease [Rhizobium sp. Khangiran2]CCF21821.1 TRAP-type C4-dicarboxylate transport system, large permease component [Pseudorhizobium banfieldiae]
MMLALVFIVMLVLIFSGLPIILAMGLVGLAGFLSVPQLVLPLFSQKMFTTLDSFSLLALPYFILAGELMAKGGISRRLVEFATAVVGHLRGSLAHANIVSSMAFAGISGSSTADTSAIGGVLIPAMKEQGYKAGYAAAVTATSSTIGAIIPPSMTMIVYGALANVSIGGLFLGGIIPGLLVTLSMMSVVYFQSLNVKKYPEMQGRGRFDSKRALRSLTTVWSALLAPLIIVGGILGGIFTATEAGVVACVYSFVVSVVFYRTIKLNELPAILLSAGLTTAMVAGIIGIAGGFGWLLAYLNFNQMILSSIMSVTTEPLLVFALLVVVMLILTMFIDSMAVLIIAVPIAVFIGQRFGIDQFQLGIALTMATQIGSTTPPVAVLLFVATSIAKCRYHETIRYVWPFIGAEVFVLVLVMMIPAIASAIPHWALN